MPAIKFDFPNRNNLESTLLKLEKELIANDVPATQPSEESIRKFSELSTEQQQQILSNISTYVQVVSEHKEESHSVRTRELARLKSALGRFNLRTANNDAFDVIAENEVIEIYNLQGIQLYRNMYFFSVCGYSLLDLSVTSWQELYDKPKSALEATQRAVQRLFGSDDQPVAYDIPAYLQKENGKFLKSLKSVEVTPKYLIPLFDVDHQKPAGAISTYGGRVIAEGEQSSRFSTLR